MTTTASPPPSTKLIHKLLLAWFDEQARFLPWRQIHTDFDLDREKYVTAVGESRAEYLESGHRDPYIVLVSELMLQQTQVDRVIPKYREFLARWPTVQDLASDQQSEVLVFWRGLGYNRRARFLHQTAVAIVQDHGGEFPKTKKELLQLPGIGEYTASAICVFAYGQDLPVLDTNVRRVLSRVFLGTESADQSQKMIEELAGQVVPKGRSDPWHQANMDLGATICQARSVKCDECPLQMSCLANKTAISSKLTYNQVLKSRVSASPKKLTQKFETTDRYFRGRIIDELREGPAHLRDLRVTLEQQYNLSDRARWGQIIESLVIDGLIQVKGATASLA